MFGKKPKIDQSVRDLINSEIRALLKTEPFLAHVGLGMRLIETGTETKAGAKPVAGMVTDGLSLEYNPEYVRSLERADIQNTVSGTVHSRLRTHLLHNILHVAFLHSFRRGKRDENKWNDAADIAVNYRLRRHGYNNTEGLGLNGDGLRSSDGKGSMDTMTTEQIYSAMFGAGNERRAAQTAGTKRGGAVAGSGERSPNKGDKSDNEGEGEGEGEEHDADAAEREAKKKVVQAAIRAREAGNMPGDMESVIEELFTSHKDWRDLLRKHLGGGSVPEQSWSRPNRRYIGDGDFLPGNAKHGPGEIVLAIDTSGSVNDDLLSRFMAEIQKINEDLQPEKIHVLCCDTKVQWNETFNSYEKVWANPLGRGGTAFSPVFDWVENSNNPTPKAVVYFTDLHCSDFWKREPEYPVYWIVWPGGANRVPWGEIIRMEE